MIHDTMSRVLLQVQPGPRHPGAALGGHGLQDPDPRRARQHRRCVGLRFRGGRRTDVCSPPPPPVFTLYTSYPSPSCFPSCNRQGVPEDHGDRVPPPPLRPAHRRRPPNRRGGAIALHAYTHAYTHTRAHTGWSAMTDACIYALLSSLPPPSCMTCSHGFKRSFPPSWT